MFEAMKKPDGPYFFLRSFKMKILLKLQVTAFVPDQERSMNAG